MLSLGKVEKPPEGRVHLMLSLGLGKVGKPSPTRAGTGQCSSAEALLDTHTFHFLMSSVRDAAARLPNGEGTRAEIDLDSPSLAHFGPKSARVGYCLETGGPKSSFSRLPHSELWTRRLEVTWQGRERTRKGEGVANRKVRG